MSHIAIAARDCMTSLLDKIAQKYSMRLSCMTMTPTIIIVCPIPCTCTILYTFTNKPYNYYTHFCKPNQQHTFSHNTPRPSTLQTHYDNTPALTLLPWLSRIMIVWVYNIHHPHFGDQWTTRVHLLVCVVRIVMHVYYAPPQYTWGAKREDKQLIPLHA